jgi:indolepyruvate ferredoxin oxidoreductase beta subunit
MNLSDLSTKKTRNILIVGVGGQGVITVSKVLASLCHMHGFQVKQSEVHGMAKRGGVVYSHVRFGEQVWSPTIPKGEADILVALEWAEGLRWLEFLRPDTGIFIADTQQIVPPFSCRNRQTGAESTYTREMPTDIIGLITNGFALDATVMAEKLGNAKAANTILLGTLSAVLDFPVEDWQSILKKLVPPKTVKVNHKAFLEGRNWIEHSQSDQTASPVNGSLPRPTEPTELESSFQFEITEAWCKSCDICVKMCPERCLRLNKAMIVEMIDLQACTGCRICEWLCPDFAIAIKKTPQSVENA